MWDLQTLSGSSQEVPRKSRLSCYTTAVFAFDGRGGQQKRWRSTEAVGDDNNTVSQFPKIGDTCMQICMFYILFFGGNCPHVHVSISVFFVPEEISQLWFNVCVCLLNLKRTPPENHTHHNHRLVLLEWPASGQEYFFWYFPVSVTFRHWSTGTLWLP